MLSLPNSNSIFIGYPFFSSNAVEVKMWNKYDIFGFSLYIRMDLHQKYSIELFPLCNLLTMDEVTLKKQFILWSEGSEGNSWMKCIRISVNNSYLSSSYSTPNNLFSVHCRKHGTSKFFMLPFTAVETWNAACGIAPKGKTKEGDVKTARRSELYPQNDSPQKQK